MLLSVYTNDLKTYVHTETYMHIFKAPLFRIAKGEWINKPMVHSYNGILLSNQKEPTPDSDNNVDEPQRHCAKGKKPDTKPTYCIIPFL